MEMERDAGWELRTADGRENYEMKKLRADGGKRRQHAAFCEIAIAAESVLYSFCVRRIKRKL